MMNLAKQIKRKYPSSMVKEVECKGRILSELLQHPARPPCDIYPLARGAVVVAKGKTIGEFARYTAA